MSDRPDLAPYRVRHNLKFRMLQVLRVQTLTPHLIRVTFTGDDLDDFESASFDDHIKVFFPAPGTDQLSLPTSGPDGLIFPGGERPVMRDFTPRRFDRAAREFDHRVRRARSRTCGELGASSQARADFGYRRPARIAGDSCRFRLALADR